MPNEPAAGKSPHRDEADPLFTNARRELKLTMLVWAAFGIWVVGLSWFTGNRVPDDLDAPRTLLGMPTWVFWGVALPWLAANAFTFWFCFGFMADDDLDIVYDEVELPGDEGRPHQDGGTHA